ncbi:TPA: hypothetical protein ACIU15_004363 [Yersinia enterocolitica]|uniref:hypothetical protein n=1 Tax=Yersinia enterocolitica TaxID=630 RepID=UPI0005E6B975|nr:hypothetical protein [Yersinia enterocolitica]EKN6068014.1 hypothetical protein [Yersinia enterocolitica]EKN6406608.1 hypothetical protein [Yersinia enterocolitica]ELZ1905899.1 hypothetical protein [Yersinia enterocolitica]CQJ56218.1 Uncharacterised protein [Yersinia enterocolitica]
MDGLSLSGMLVFIVKLLIVRMIFGSIMLLISKIRKLLKKDKVEGEVEQNDSNNTNNSKKP